MTRFSRVTFNAAHRYLGLTAEVLRTEKAINDIACHPLPSTFYESGGMQQLRQRFDGVKSQEFSLAQPEPDDEYFSLSPTSVSPRSTKTRLSPKRGFSSPVKLRENVHFPPPRTRSSRHFVQAGDLHTSTLSGDVYKPLGRSFSILNTPHSSRRDLSDGSVTPEFLHFDGVDFDLRQEVMNCIAVSIGLSQPPLSDNASSEASPSFSATDSGQIPQSTGFLQSPFGSLSLLEMGDDSSSATGGSSSVTAGGYGSGLDNGVEILFFSEGSYLARAGERDIGAFLLISTFFSLQMAPGLFFVIEGFLDIVLPTEGRSFPENELRARQSTPTVDSLYDVEATTTNEDGNISSIGSSKESSRRSAPSVPQRDSSLKGRRPLFTVKPGGIAGYLGDLTLPI